MLAQCVAAERQEESHDSGVEDNVPFCCIAKSRAETATFTAAHYTVVAVMPSSQRLFTHAGVESTQLVYNGRALRVLIDVLGDFRVNPLLH